MKQELGSSANNDYKADFSFSFLFNKPYQQPAGEAQQTEPKSDAGEEHTDNVDMTADK